MNVRELRYLTDDTPQVLPTFANVAAELPRHRAADGEVPRYRHRAEQGAARQRGGDRAGAVSRQRNRAAGHPVHRDLGQGQGGGDRQRDHGDRSRRQSAVDAPSGRSSPAARADSAASVGRRPSVDAPGSRARPGAAAADLPQQALLYRLCGDRNPLHSDPEFASAAGFPEPILHGLCTYGMACKAIVDTLLDGDVRSCGSYGARFAGVVFPGETLQANIWKAGRRIHRDGHRTVARQRRGAGGVEFIPA